MYKHCPRNIRSAVFAVIVLALFALVTLGFVSVFAAQEVKLPPDKQVIVDRIAAEQATVARHPKSKNDPTEIAFATQVAVSLLTPIPTPTIVTGIRAVNMSPFASTDAIAENRWQDMVNGVLVIVYAGGMSQDMSQGFVAVQVGDVQAPVRRAYPPTVSGSAGAVPDNASATFPTLTRYLTPGKDGPVKITAVSGSTFTLQAEDGKTFIFDLNTRDFN